MTSKSFSVRIYLQDGHTDGVKIIARSKWSGRAMVIPRASFPTEKGRDELQAPGVYVLIGPPDEEGRDTIYIGAADPVVSDLEKHDVSKNFWTWTIVCSAKDNSLTREHIKYLAVRLIQLAQAAGKADLENHDASAPPVLDDAALAYSEAFLEHILSLYPVLGLRAFENC